MKKVHIVSGFSLLMAAILFISFSKETINVPRAFEPSYRDGIVNCNHLRYISDTKITGLDSNYGNTLLTIDENKNKIQYLSIYKVPKKSCQGGEKPRLFIIISSFSFSSEFEKQAGSFHLRV